MFFISTLPTLHCKSYLSHLNTNARRLCSTYRPYRHVGYVLSLLLLYFFSGDRCGPGRTSYYILTTPSFSLCTRKWIFTQILACHVTRLTGPITGRSRWFGGFLPLTAAKFRLVWKISNLSIKFHIKYMLSTFSYLNKVLVVSGSFIFQYTNSWRQVNNQVTSFLTFINPNITNNGISSYKYHINQNCEDVF